MDVRIQNHMEPINTLCVPNVLLLTVKAGGTSVTGGLQGAKYFSIWCTFKKINANFYAVLVDRHSQSLYETSSLLIVSLFNGNISNQF
jgi:hypothetical protein